MLVSPPEARVLAPRTKPRQQRSRKRVDLILKTAKDLLVERGFDAVNTNLIAERAGIPVGSIYQFFPNKFAIFYKLAAQYMDGIGEIHKRYARLDDEAGSWAEAIDHTIDDVAEFWATEKAMPILWRGMYNSPDLLLVQGEAEKKSEDYSVAFLDSILPELDPLRRRLIARVMVHVSERLMDLSILDQGDQRLYLLEELKVLVKAYIGSYIDETKRSPGLG